MYFFKFLKIKGILCTILEIAMLLSLCYAEPSENAPWRSILYPEDWKPDFTCNDETYGEMFLHDFSYAGYHTGLKPIPVSPPGETYDVTAPPYNADNTGTTETSAAIQKAIDDAAAAGGGVVYLPAGTYRVRP